MCIIFFLAHIILYLTHYPHAHFLYLLSYTQYPTLNNPKPISNLYSPLQINLKPNPNNLLPSSHTAALSIPTSLRSTTQSMRNHLIPHTHISPITLAAFNSRACSPSPCAPSPKPLSREPPTPLPQANSNTMPSIAISAILHLYPRYHQRQQPSPPLDELHPLCKQSAAPASHANTPRPLLPW